MTKSKPKLKVVKKVVKLDDKRQLRDDEQIDLVRDKVLDLFDEIHEKVTIPNTIIAMQVLVTDLAFDTAPSNTVATSMLLDIINHRLRHEVEKEHEDD
jgi:Glu-tRNA(Gln) amidotransferase subunit E-like FAD-binding protein